MTESAQIELIVTTVADYYGIKWQDLWRSMRRHRAARHNLIKLIKESGVMLDCHSISEITHINRHTVWNNLVRSDDNDLQILRNKIESYITIKRTA
jgi:hypothetical protein